MGDAASAIIGVAFAGTVIMLFGPLVRALARRLEGRGRSTELLADVEALRGRWTSSRRGSRAWRSWRSGWISPSGCWPRLESRTGFNGRRTAHGPARGRT